MPAILAQAIYFGSSLSLLTRDRRVVSFVCTKTCSHVQEGMDQSGSPRRLAASDSWQASTVRAVATCRISAACSSDWEASTGVEKLAEDKFAARQPPECAPDQLRAAASVRIQRIQASLGALQPEDKEERQALLTALEKAKRQAKMPSMEQQIHAMEEYLARAKKRFLQHDATIAAAREALLKAEHDKEVDVQGVADGEDLLRKLKTHAADLILPMPIADPVGEVARLQQVVADLPRHGAPVVPTQGVSAVPSISPLRIRKREDYVPATEHEVLEWMTDRQEEMTAALMARNPTEAARISSLITDATRSLQPESVPPSMVTNMVR